MFGKILYVAVFMGFFSTICHAQTFEETVNYIITGNKAWSSVKYASFFVTTLTEYNEKECFVHVTTKHIFGSIIDARISLSMLSNLTWQSYCMQDAHGRCNGDEVGGLVFTKGRER